MGSSYYPGKRWKLWTQNDLDNYIQSQRWKVQSEMSQENGAQDKEANLMEKKLKYCLQEDYLILTLDEMKSKYCIWESAHPEMDIIKERDDDTAASTKEGNERNEDGGKLSSIDANDHSIKAQNNNFQPNSLVSKSDDDICSTEFEYLTPESFSSSSYQNEYMDADLKSILKTRPQYYLSQLEQNQDQSRKKTTHDSNVILFEWDSYTTGFHMMYHPYLPLLLFYERKNIKEGKNKKKVSSVERKGKKKDISKKEKEENKKHKKKKEQ